MGTDTCPGLRGDVCSGLGAPRLPGPTPRSNRPRPLQPLPRSGPPAPSGKAQVPPKHLCPQTPCGAERRYHKAWRGGRRAAAGLLHGGPRGWNLVSFAFQKQRWSPKKEIAEDRSTASSSIFFVLASNNKAVTYIKSSRHTSKFRPVQQFGGTFHLFQLFLNPPPLQPVREEIISHIRHC